jgi:hypothetical protein
LREGLRKALNGFKLLYNKDLVCVADGGLPKKPGKNSPKGGTQENEI